MKWRSRSLSKLNLSDGLRRKNSMFESVPGKLNTDPDTPNSSSSSTSVEFLNIEKNSWKPDAIAKRHKSAVDAIVRIVIVEAKGLPDLPDDNPYHGVFCRFGLGVQRFTTKSVSNTRRPQWRESFRFNLYNDDPLLKISLWHRGKQKNFMGSCVLDLSNCERERTHDIWLNLNEGYGFVHFTIIICNIRSSDVDASTTPDVQEVRQQYAFYNLKPNLEVIGQLFVKVIGARGLHGKPNAYCSLELDNEKVRTSRVHSCSEPVWNKTYVLNVYDVTSVLEVTVINSSITSFLVKDLLGRVTIPLLRIAESEARWYGLKDADRRKSAKGNYPRIQLEMSMIWNPVAASLKLFRPKQVKYIAKPPKFDLGLMYKNLKFTTAAFMLLKDLNEGFKRAFEWEDREIAFVALLAWLAFCANFSPWTIPLFLLVPFIYFLYNEQKQHQEFVTSVESNIGHMSEEVSEERLTDKVQQLTEISMIINEAVEYTVSVAERLHNLVAFKVPFLSWLTMIMLLGSSFIFYYIPFRYLMMALGIYKFVRKQLNPGRVLNNDLLDFISRIPDNNILKDWKELSVPEPQPERRSPPTPQPVLTTSRSMEHINRFHTP